MSLVHGYLVGDVRKMFRDNKALAEHRVVEVESPYGVINFDAQVWFRCTLAHGSLVICDQSIRSGSLSVGEPFVSP
jgi:hypothetical protein